MADTLSLVGDRDKAAGRRTPSRRHRPVV